MNFEQTPAENSDQRKTGLSPSLAELVEKKEGDPRLKKIRKIVSRVLMTAGVLGFYGVVISDEIWTAKKKRQERAAFEEKLIQEFEQERQIKENHYENLTIKQGVLPAETLGNIVRSGYPKGWFESVAIVQSEEEYSLAENKQYGTTDPEVLASATCTSRPEGSLITFYPAGRNGDNPYDVIHGLSHESCHAVEQRLRRTDLPAHEALMARIQERVVSPGRWSSEYVESIRDEDEATRLNNKAVEYWATICSEYLRGPDQLAVQDFKLVDEVVKKYDPKFVSLDGRANRWHYLEEALKKKNANSQIATNTDIQP